MPRYDYDCAACGRRFEVILGIHDDGPAVCALCGSGPVKKAFTPPTIHFKGSGWAKKERRAASASSASRASSADKASTDEASGSGSGSSASEVPKDEGSKVIAEGDAAKGDGSKAGSDSSPAKSGGSTSGREPREPRETRESTAKGPAPTGGSAGD